MKMERLQKAMAEAGVASRRASEKLIVEGHVKVNGKLVTELGTKVSSSDQVTVDGVPLEREQPEYYLLNKPRGVITSVHDEHGRKTVVDILKEGGVTARIYPVGRLDYDTTGVLLLTNDGALANKLMHPSFEIEKTYVAKVKGLISNHDLEQLRHGVVIDGKKTKEAKPKLLSVDKQHRVSIVRLTIHEGRYHQVKKMFKAVGHPVEKLTRESDGILNLKGLPGGQWRELKMDEINALKKL